MQFCFQVIVRKDDEICLLCKGADSTIYERLDPKCLDLQAKTTTHLEVTICSILNTS